jgi:hypothetical protein
MEVMSSLSVCLFLSYLMMLLNCIGSVELDKVLSGGTSQNS